MSDVVVPTSLETAWIWGWAIAVGGYVVEPAIDWGRTGVDPAVKRVGHAAGVWRPAGGKTGTASTGGWRTDAGGGYVVVSAVEWGWTNVVDGDVVVPAVD